MGNFNELMSVIEVAVLRVLHRSEARGCRVINTATQTITAGAITALTFNTEIHDTDGCWDAGSPTRLTAARDGYYQAGGSYFLAAAQVDAADRLEILVRKNGIPYYLGPGSDLHTISGQNAFLGVSDGMFWLSAGDYVEILAGNYFAANKTVSAATLTDHRFCHGWLMRVG